MFGAGGDRDKAKRPLLGAAARAADRILLTSDNPRSESPETIIAEIAEGIGQHASLARHVDRAQAILLAIAEASEDDLILIAGKGHEQTQEVAGQKTAFSDVAIVRQSGDPAR